MCEKRLVLAAGGVRGVRGGRGRGGGEGGEGWLIEQPLARVMHLVMARVLPSTREKETAPAFPAESIALPPEPLA